MLDSSLGRFLDLPCTPDIVILPSELNIFAKAVPCSGWGQAGSADPRPESKVVFINPGRLTKGPTGGTFAHLTVNPSKEGVAASEGAPPETNGRIPHGVDLRCRVDLRRI